MTDVYFKVDQVQSSLTDKVDELRNLIESQLEDNGLTSEESQRMYLLNQLNEFQHRINGIIFADLKH